MQLRPGIMPNHAINEDDDCYKIPVMLTEQAQPLYPGQAYKYIAALDKGSATLHLLKHCFTQ
jgi:hypothetical protein